MAKAQLKANRKLVASVGEIEHGQSKKFTLRRGQRDLRSADRQL